MSDLADLAILQHPAHGLAAVQKPQLMIYQRQHAGFVRFFRHPFCFQRVHCHRFFAKHGLASLERRQGDFHVGRWRSDHTYEIDVIAFNQLTPVVGDVFNAKFLRDTLCVFAMAAGDRYDSCSLTIAKAGDLRRARKAGADDTNTYRFLFTQVRLPSLDTFYPFVYPKEWEYEGRSWNETYLLRAFLQYNSTFRVYLYSSFLQYFHDAEFKQDMPLSMIRTGASIWIKKLHNGD